VQKLDRPREFEEALISEQTLQAGQGPSARLHKGSAKKKGSSAMRRGAYTPKLGGEGHGPSRIPQTNKGKTEAPGASEKKFLASVTTVERSEKDRPYKKYVLTSCNQ